MRLVRTLSEFWVSTRPLQSRDTTGKHKLTFSFSPPTENTPQYVPLFEDIAKYTSSLLARHANPPTQPLEADEGHAAKKRKLQNGNVAGNTQSPGDVKAEASLQFYMQDVSFAIPQRKKLTLEVTAGRGFLRARNQTSKEVEFGVPLDRIRKF